jgi:hypothetical protein
MRAVALDFACRYYNLLGNIAGSADCVNLTYYNNGVKKIPAFAQCLAPQQRSYDGASYGLSFGYASSGDDGSSASANSRVYATALIHGNVTIADNAIGWNSSIADHSLPPSLYLTGKPAWFGSVPWPPLGPDVAGFTNKIPAQLRFEGGLNSANGKSSRRPGLPAAILSVTGGTLRYRVTQPGRVRLEILDLAGRRLEMPVDRQMNAGEYTSPLHFRASPAGIFVCRLTVGEFTEMRAAVICR